MKIVFVSNYLNHHQIPLCEAFCSISNVNFTFIATQEVEEERIAMGYMTDFSGIPYLINAIDDSFKKQAEDICFNADVVIFGSAPLSLVKRRLKAKKLTFNYSERWFKKGFFNHPREIASMIKNYTIKGNKNYFQLCASAYTAEDSNKVFCFPNRKFKWGYFPLCKRYENLDDLIINKKKNSIVWVARFIDWKHPEHAISLAKNLKDGGYDFKIKMIGNGELLSSIMQKVKDLQLDDYVEILGAMSPDEVRQKMEESEIHIFTSDRNEGWGAVLNEAMNSGCVCVASKSIGVVPYLIKDGKNGFIYENDDFDEFYNKVKFLLDNSKKRVELGKKAYETIINEWNAEVAAERLYDFCKAKLNRESLPIYEDGPMAKDNGRMSNDRKFKRKKY